MASKKEDKKVKVAEETEGALVDFHYEDAPDKPDPDTIAQVQVIHEK